MLLTFVLAALFVFPASAQAASWKKDYCNNQTYYTNTGADEGGTYPHLHCDKSFITYSAGSGSNSNRYEILVGDNLNKGTAGSACYKALEQSALNLKDIVKSICSDFSQTCSGC